MAQASVFCILVTCTTFSILSTCLHAPTLVGLLLMLTSNACFIFYVGSLDGGLLKGNPYHNKAQPRRFHRRGCCHFWQEDIWWSFHKIVVTLRYVNDFSYAQWFLRCFLSANSTNVFFWGNGLGWLVELEDSWLRIDWVYRGRGICMGECLKYN